MYVLATPHLVETALVSNQRARHDLLDLLFHENANDFRTLSLPASSSHVVRKPRDDVRSGLQPPIKSR
jgi:hypothetical protein